MSTTHAAAEPAKTRPLLEVRSLEVAYHRAVTAIQGVSFQVMPGSITAIVGTNGAGKTTTLSAVAGLLNDDVVQIMDGAILLDGQPIHRKPPHVISRSGVSLVPERDKVWPTLTVAENLRACLQSGRPADGFMVEDAYRLFPILQQRRHQVCGYLSGGERQMLALAMALLGNPKLLMVDELSLGLAPAVVTKLLEVLQQLQREQGCSILLVEQNATTALRVSDYVYVMENGRVVFDGTPVKLMAHEDFREFYLGIGEEGRSKSYQDVKQYRRKRRWFG